MRNNNKRPFFENLLLHGAHNKQHEKFKREERVIHFALFLGP